MNTQSNASQKIVAGLAALVLLAGFSFGESRPRGSSPQATVAVVSHGSVQPLVGAELPQDQVRDMTYN